VSHCHSTGFHITMDYKSYNAMILGVPLLGGVFSGIRIYFFHETEARFFPESSKLGRSQALFF
jgi:hypothetical protein